MKIASLLIGLLFLTSVAAPAFAGVHPHTQGCRAKCDSPAKPGGGKRK